MAAEKSLLKNVSIGFSGRLHRCRQDKRHELPKGAPMMIVKEGRDSSHYCTTCGMKFLRTAADRVRSIERDLVAARDDHSTT